MNNALTYHNIVESMPDALKPFSDSAHHELIAAISKNSAVYVSSEKHCFISDSLGKDEAEGLLSFLVGSGIAFNYFMVSADTIKKLRQSLGSDAISSQHKPNLRLISAAESDHTSVAGDDEDIQSLDLTKHHQISNLLLSSPNLFVSDSFIGYFSSNEDKSVCMEINRYFTAHRGSSLHWYKKESSYIQKLRTKNGLDSKQAVSFVAGFDDVDLPPLFKEIINAAIDAGSTDVRIALRKSSLKSNIAMRVKDSYKPLVISTPVSRENLEAMARALINAYLVRQDAATRRDFSLSEPQDCQIPFKLSNGNEINIRYSSIPEQGGCAITLRIPNTRQNTKPMGLKELGLEPQQVALVEEALRSGSGGIFFTGKTGSGKTTMIASCLDLLPEYSSVITMQDPIEINIQRPVMIHVPINDESPTMNWSRIAGQTLRHDPEVLMVGEIRLDDVAKTLVQMTDTGHLVLTTLHVGSAIAVPRRLATFNIGDRELRNETLFRLIVAVKLLETLCPSCKIPLAKVTPRATRHIRVKKYFSQESSACIRNEAGCEKCGHTGLVGKTSIAEVLVPTPYTMELIIENRTAELRKLLRDAGWISLEDHAAMKVKRGYVCAFMADDELDIKFGSSDIESVFDYSAFAAELCELEA